MRIAEYSLLALLLAGCPDRTISDVVVDQGKVEVKDIPAVPKRDIDILFVVDDSQSMLDEQESLKANFPKMIDVLDSIDGGRPDVQIGVVTPNLGTGSLDGTHAQGVGTCQGDGDDGILRQLPGSTVRFLRDVDDGAGGRTTNYPGTLPDAFRQLASVGSDGCGIEQHLEAMVRATDGSNAENAGFLRPDAYLAVIVIADEDDCSLEHSQLFDDFDRVSDPQWGPKTNFRCTSQGVVCDTPATPFEDALGVRQNCHPRTDDTELTHVDRYVDHLKNLKADPRDVVVAGIVGDPGNFEIVDDGGVHVLGNACPGGGTTKVAFPAVRTDAFLSQFPLHDRSTICASDLSNGLTEIGALIKKVLVEPCFDNTLLDVDPTTPGPQYECSVTEVRRHPGEADEELGVLPPCEAGGSPCWKIVEDAAHCGYTHADPHLKLVIDGLPADPSLRIKANCVTANPAVPTL